MKSAELKLARNNGLLVTASANGKPPQSFKILKGSPHLTFNGANAAAVGIAMGDYNPVSWFLADNKKVSAQRAEVASAKFGDLEVSDAVVLVKSVEFINQDNEVGILFLNRFFDCELDEQNLMLTLTEVNDPSIKKSVSRNKKKR